MPYLLFYCRVEDLPEPARELKKEPKAEPKEEVLDSDADVEMTDSPIT